MNGYYKIISFFFSIVCFPLFAFGDDFISWDFKESEAAYKWRISGAKLIKPSKSGLKMSGEKFIKLLTPEGLSVQAEKYQLLELRVKISKVFGRIGVAWAQHGSEKAKNREIVQVLKNTGRFETVRINLNHHPEWAGEIGQILFGFYSADGEVEVESIRIWRPTLLKKIQFAWTEFFHPEYFRPLSINAIHGPNLLGKKWISWNYILVIFLVLIIFLYRKIINVRMFFSLVFVLWIIFDVRFSYDMALSLENLRERVAVPGEKKPRYIIGDLHEFAEFCNANIPSFAHVNYYAPTDIFFPRFKYAVYPRKAAYDSENGEYFVVHNDSSVLVRGRQLIREVEGAGNVIWTKGLLKSRYNSGSFIYKKGNTQRSRSQTGATSDT